MPLDERFYAVSAELFHPGMGTEHVGPLLHSITCMRRPERIVAVGLGYSTLFLLQALADVKAERERDREILSGNVQDRARAEVLLPIEAVCSAASRHLIAIDDFSDDQGRLAKFDECVDRLRLRPYITVCKQRYQDWHPSEPEMRADMVWLDCGHQLDYSEMCNRFWPLVSDDGGLLAMHYTFVDVQPEPDQPAVVISGPWANAVKSEQARLGGAAKFEMLSLVEPHKRRQGSLTILRKSPDDACRETTMEQEQKALYGRSGEPLNSLNEPIE